MAQVRTGCLATRLEMATDATPSELRAAGAAPRAVGVRYEDGAAAHTVRVRAGGEVPPLQRA